MKQNYRASMILLHTYSGLFMGWLLFAIFLTGTLSYFNHEISHWMRGVVSHPQQTLEQLEKAYQYLLNNAENGKNWQINLANQRGSQLSVQWQDEAGRHSHGISPESAPQQSKATQGGRFFVTFHYTLQLRQYGGRYLAGLAAMTMLIALYSGIFAHRRLIKDFFTLRTRSLLHLLKDSHAISGIVTIPFVIVICLSALVIYINLFAPWFADAHFDKGYRQMSRQVSERLPTLPGLPQATTPVASLNQVIIQAKQTWADTVTLKSIRLDQPFLSTGRIIIEGIDQQAITNNTQKLIYSSNTGDIVAPPSTEGVARKVRRVLYGLHEGHFFKADLRWLSFIQGAIATYLIASGMLLWVKKRAEKRAHSHRTLTVIRKINLAVFVGLPLACLAYFACNQVLPINLANREELELAAFNYTLLATAATLVCLKPAKGKLLFALVATLLTTVVVVMDLTTLLSAIKQGDMIYLIPGVFMWIMLLANFSLCWHLFKNYPRET